MKMVECFLVLSRPCLVSLEGLFWGISKEKYKHMSPQWAGHFSVCLCVPHLSGHFSTQNLQGQLRLENLTKASGGKNQGIKKK